LGQGAFANFAALAIEEDAEKIEPPSGSAGEGAA
jgi:hypothetical protein